ncbi:MAG TPA: exodeoxyribonuclease VII large subunit, partial [Elusimicrobiota bacterium]|nr:exodeoxyribonuclease VII large subunit [Elusimicrobiota bacterium]
ALADTAARVRETAVALLRESRRDLTESVREWRQSAALLIQRHRAFLSESSRGLRLNVRRHMDMGRERLLQIRAQLGRHAVEKIRQERERLAAFAKECRLKDPRRLLERGYSLITQNGRLVKRMDDVGEGQQVEAQVGDGFFSATVLRKRKVTS